MSKELLTLKALGLQPKNILDIGACVLNWTRDCMKVFPNADYTMVDGTKHFNQDSYLVEILSDEIKEVDWYTDIYSLGGYGQGSSIFKEKTNHWKEIKPEKRTTNTLDNLFPDSTFEIIKIDTQGSEIPILKGGKELVQRAEAVLLELPFYCKLNEGVPSFLEHIQFMDSINFIPKDITEIHQSGSDMKNATLQVDILFIKKDHPINEKTQEAINNNGIITTPKPQDQPDQTKETPKITKTGKDFATYNYKGKEYKFYQSKNKNSLNFSDADKYFDEFKEDTKFYSEFLKEGDIVIDIGARDGDSVLPLRACVGESGKVLAFDPNPHEYPNLVENVKLNNFKNVETYDFGISQQDGEQEFLYNEDFYNGGIKTMEIQAGYFPDSISLPCKNWTTLPDSIKRDFNNASLIKIDTEGSDLNILEEVSESIMTSRPYIVTEWWPTYSYAEAMGNFLRTKNYICFSKKNGNKIDLEYTALCQREHDIFFIPIERLLDSKFHCGWTMCQQTRKPVFVVPKDFKYTSLFE